MPPSSRAITNARYSHHKKSSCLLSTTQLSCSLVSLSRELRFCVQGCTLALAHISSMLPYRIRFVLCRFRSLLFTASLLFSFPPGTKMLQFPGFPFLSKQFRDPWFSACMRLAMAYRSLPRPSSEREPSHPRAGARYSQHVT